MSKIKLGDITKIRTGKLDANASSENGKYPFFTCSKDPLRIDSYSYDCECVLVAGNGDLNVKYYNGKFDAYQRTYIIEDNSKGRLFIPYLYYFLELYVEELRKQSIGGVIKYIKLGNLTDAIIELPSIEKQKEIVNILDKSRKIVDSKNVILQSYDQLIKSRFVEMFGTLENTKYEVETLMNLSDFITDGTHQTPTYTADSNAGYKFLSSKDVTSGKIDWSNIKYIPEELHKELYNRITPRKNDILLAKNGTTGTAALVDVDEVFDIYVSLAIIRLRENIINPIYTLHAINSIDTKRQFNASLKGVGVPNLHLGEIRKAKIIVPPIELQNNYAKFVEQVDKLKFVVQQSLDETQKLFDSLMQKYFG
ncbi:MAG: restriction endonuclease subunit S [Bacilli bacterium]